MVINDDWLIKSIYDKLVEALDEILTQIKKNGLLNDPSFENWTDDLYKIIYKHSNHD